MDDPPGGVTKEGSRLVPDGGVDGCWGAGRAPPEPPEDTGALVDELDSDSAAAEQRYVVRVALAAASEEYARRVVEQLRTEMTVVGTSFSTDAGPDAPGVFDVLVSMDYRPSTVANALVKPSEIDAVTVVRATAPPTESGAAPPGSPDGEVPDDEVTGDDGPAADEGADDEGSAADDEDEPGDDPDVASDETDDETDDEPTAESMADESTPAADDDVAVDAPGVTDNGSSEATVIDTDEAAVVDPDEELASVDSSAIFDELKETTERVGYEELVAELDQTSLPGDFRDEVDLGPILEEHGDGEGSESVSTGTMDVRDGDIERRGAVPGGELDAGRVVTALVAAVEEDRFDDEQRRAIADAFDPGPPTTLVDRVDELEDRVAAVDALRARVDDLEERVEELTERDSTAESTGPTAESLAAEVTDAERRLRELESWQDRIRTVMGVGQSDPDEEGEEGELGDEGEEGAGDDEPPDTDLSGSGSA